MEQLNVANKRLRTAHDDFERDYKRPMLTNSIAKKESYWNA